MHATNVDNFQQWRVSEIRLVMMKDITNVRRKCLIATCVEWATNNIVAGIAMQVVLMFS